jgi:ribulose-phosphate 3-epimerase
MSVNPGFGGQKYIEGVTRKIESLKSLIKTRGRNIDIEVDGGIDTDNIFDVTKAGANVIVSGSTIFSAKDTAKIIKELKENAYRE